MASSDDIVWDDWLDPSAYATEDEGTAAELSPAPVPADSVASEPLSVHRTGELAVEPKLSQTPAENQPAAENVSHAESLPKASSSHADHSPSGDEDLGDEDLGDEASNYESSDSYVGDDDDENFPPGQDQPGFVPIGTPGVASKAQGNTKDLDKDLKSRILMAERAHKLHPTWPQIHHKYSTWGVTQSRLRGMHRNATLARKDRQRVIKWTLEDVSSCTFLFVFHANSDLEIRSPR